MSTTWQSVTPPPSQPALQEDLTVDIGIIGGGLTGLLAAYLVSEAGQKVAIFEAGRLGDSSVTMYTTAFLSAVIDTDFKDLIEIYGRDQARLIWESGVKAIDLIEEIIRKENIECEFMRVSARVFAGSGQDPQSLQDEHQALQTLGVDCQIRSAKDLPIKTQGFLEITNQGKFHPIKFLYGLADKLLSRGTTIYENTEVMEITPTGAKTKQGINIIAQKILVATYRPVETPSVMFGKKGNYKTYILELQLPPNSLPEGIYWDTHNPYYYFRVDAQENFDRVILGGADHREELHMSEHRGFANLLDYFKKTFGPIRHTVVRQWAGTILEGSDGLALIGEYAPSRFVATAFSGNGMTYAAISAMMFRDYILGQKNPWERLYDPRRRRKFFAYYKKGLDYTQEFFGGAIKNLKY